MKLFAGYVRSFAQLARKSMAGRVAIVPALNNGGKINNLIPRVLGLLESHINAL